MFYRSDLSAQRRTLDLRSSGRPELEVTQILAGDEVIANAVELSSWNSPAAQALVCERCEQ